MCFAPFRKICHLGPVVALAIIKIITLMTLHCSRQWWSPHAYCYSDITFMVFAIFSGLTLYYFINCIYEGPGYLPYNWIPKNESDYQYLQFCHICQGYKAPRSHHCRKCNRCVLKMDHHCPWINNCVGHYNHGSFTAFLACAIAGCCLSTYKLVSWLLAIFSMRTLPFQPPSILILVLVLFSIGLSVGVVIAVGTLLYFQIQAIVKNQTGIESWIIEKANYRRSTTAEPLFVNPYSKGLLFNVRQVLSWHCTPAGDGIDWPIVDGCDQYTLTREQLAQKEEKRKRARRYRVVSKVTGSWFPISYGIKVFCSPPCTDESRIKLDIGDTIIVTRWRSNWLFGEKELDQPIIKGEDNRVRGWFPRASVIPVYENGNNLDSYDSDPHVRSKVSIAEKSTETESIYNSRSYRKKQK